MDREDADMPRLFNVMPRGIHRVAEKDMYGRDHEGPE